MEVTVRLNQGENVIAVRAQNGSDAGGVLADLRLGGESTVVTDSTWLVSTNEEPGWNTLAFNAAHWAPAKSLGPHGIQPWGDVLQSASATPAQALRVPSGFKVELLRSAQPGEGSWVCAAFDDRGRLILSPQEEAKPFLRLSFKDGQVDRVEPFAETLRQAMGILRANDGFYISGKGPKGTGLYRLKDADGDDRFGPAEIQFLIGYEGGGEHGYHAVRLGPDGRLYLLNGNGTKLPAHLASTSPHRNYAQDVLALGGSENRMAQPAGYILRADAEGTQWELWMGGLRNAYDFDFNPDGELFTFDSDMEWDWGAPWYRPTRIVHCVSGAEFGWREERGTWPDHYEDSLPAVVNVGIGSPTGVEFGAKSHFPEKYRRALFAMDWSYGRIFAVRLTPNGATYTGEAETFLRGTPLNLTDLAFGPDGAMYFITGGRGTQSGLYRVSHDHPARDSVTALAAAQTNQNDTTKARILRRQLESFHGRQDSNALTVIWPHLGSPDRAIRYAARIALEAQPVSAWQARALSEANPTAGLTALLALSRVASASVQPALLEALARFPIGKLDETHRVLKYRVIQLSFLRHGQPAAPILETVRTELGSQFPAPTWPQNRELARLLSWLEAPGFVAKTIPLLESAATHEEQLHYIEQLRDVKTGWSPDLRRRYFSWWLQPHEKAEHPAALHQWFADVDRRYVDGAWMDKYLGEFRRDAVANLTGAERLEFAALLETPLRPAQMVPRSTRQFVREWTMADLLPYLPQASSRRNFERGRQAFVDAQCLSCHRFGNDGGSLGPELTAIGSKYDRRSLLESILEPSKALNEQYLNTTLELSDGETLTGRLVGDSPQEVEIETNPFGGGREEIPRKNIKRIIPSKFSPMPEGLVNTLQREEILDLLAYLESNGRSSAAAFQTSAR
jgi:putative heme-binding domain-containing protein